MDIFHLNCFWSFVSIKCIKIKAAQAIPPPETISGNHNSYRSRNRNDTHTRKTMTWITNRKKCFWLEKYLSFLFDAFGRAKCKESCGGPKSRKKFARLVYHRLMRCKDAEQLVEVSAKQIRRIKEKSDEQNPSITIVTTKNAFACNFWLWFGFGFSVCSRSNQSKIDKNAWLLWHEKKCSVFGADIGAGPSFIIIMLSQVKKCTHCQKSNENKKLHMKLHPEIFAEDRRAALPHNYAYLIAIWLYPSQPWHSNTLDLVRFFSSSLLFI